VDREPGFYWIRIKEEHFGDSSWQPAKWDVDEYDEGWEILGVDYSMEDKDIEEVGDKIKR